MRRIIERLTIQHSYISTEIFEMRRIIERLNNTTHNVDCYSFSIYFYIIHWTGQFSDRRRLCIFEDEDNFVYDISSMSEKHRGGDPYQKE